MWQTAQRDEDRAESKSVMQPEMTTALPGDPQRYLARAKRTLKAPRRSGPNPRRARGEVGGAAGRRRTRSGGRWRGDGSQKEVCNGRP
jgi:hypothetical protein